METEFVKLNSDFDSKPLEFWDDEYVKEILSDNDIKKLIRELNISNEEIKNHFVEFFNIVKLKKRNGFYTSVFRDKKTGKLVFEFGVDYNSIKPIDYETLSYIDSFSKDTNPKIILKYENLEIKKLVDLVKKRSSCFVHSKNFTKLNEISNLIANGYLQSKIAIGYTRLDKLHKFLLANIEDGNKISTFLEDAKNCEVLILDGLGLEPTKSFLHFGTLMNILLTRKANRKQTIFFSVFNPEEYKKFLYENYRFVPTKTKFLINLIFDDKELVQIL
ncbi:hypothetical protein [Metamycoplasma hyosynoviae]|uniref:hypothetical protein n=1 Tax=Metamycoplasma hyosynoviae TaxID=29559 RepID=UPI0004618CF0|nr:hypothetical protein [Metamycoplasma hyosynoviae]KDE45315.1 hypothetical protein NPL4_01600 [Metamycoplasma hyosynoviae]MDD1361023.1 hypothetical protein [Metamycoplasma hyosynoviae]MDD1362033.1 hypothetical protein [Metamycoplasma hyosynoviae]MDD1373751.1 hypothetical protein [Metamycoplasma hyosynoviae]MDD1374144.1 hypothetical protein [Metamycoplasma hyosynoviae]